MSNQDQNPLGYIVHTLQELQNAEGEDVLVLGSSHRPGISPGTVYRGTGEDAPGDAWYDTGNEYNVGSDDIMLPAHVFFVPQKPARTITDELKQSGYILAVEDFSFTPLQVPNWINPESLKDVTDSEDEEIQKARSNASESEWLGKRIFLITESQAVRDYGVHGTVVFRSRNTEGYQSVFMILEAKPSQKDQKAAEAGADDDEWKGRK